MGEFIAPDIRVVLESFMGKRLILVTQNDPDDELGEFVSLGFEDGTEMTFPIATGFFIGPGDHPSFKKFDG